MARAPGLGVHVVALNRTGNALHHEATLGLRPLKGTFRSIGVWEYADHLMIGFAGQRHVHQGILQD